MLPSCSNVYFSWLLLSFIYLFYFYFILPLIHLFLQLPVEFVYPLLQPLPPLLGGQVAVVFQRRRLVVKAGNAHSRLLSHWNETRVPRWRRQGCSDSSASAELLFLTADRWLVSGWTHAFPGNGWVEKKPGSARGCTAHRLAGHEWLSWREVCADTKMQQSRKIAHASIQTWGYIDSSLCYSVFCSLLRNIMYLFNILKKITAY